MIVAFCSKECRIKLLYVSNYTKTQKDIIRERQKSAQSSRHRSLTGDAASVSQVENPKNAIQKKSKKPQSIEANQKRELFTFARLLFDLEKKLKGNPWVQKIDFEKSLTESKTQKGDPQYVSTSFQYDFRSPYSSWKSLYDFIEIVKAQKHA